VSREIEGLAAITRRAVAILGAFALSVLPAAASPHIGEVIAVGFDFCPAGWARMNGQLLPISENEFLFQLIGTSYGGDGTTTFALPLTEPLYTIDRKPLIQCISLFGIFPSRP
jgi:microcystin-dependent protein